MNVGGETISVSGMPNNQYFFVLTGEKSGSEYSAYNYRISVGGEGVELPSEIITPTQNVLTGDLLESRSNNQFT